MASEELTQVEVRQVQGLLSLLVGILRNQPDMKVVMSESDATRGGREEVRTSFNRVNRTIEVWLERKPDD